jgi:hypothetical protein
MASKQHLLTDFAQRVARAATGGYLGKPLQIQQVVTVAGPRAGALHIHAGLDAGRLLKALSASDSAALRQFIPWRFVGNPAAYMHGRAVRVEAGWPPELAESDIPLHALSPYPKGDGRWVVGLNEHGQTIVTGVNLDRTPHWLISGATGSGKTVALRSALIQLASDPQNRLVIIDGKRGASFRGHGLRGMVGPLATRPSDWQAALLWAVNEMMERYENGGEGRLVVAIDEVQEVIQADAASAEAVRRLVVMGREAAVHCLLATQHPIVKSLGGPTVTRNLVGRMALRVADYDASRVATGGNAPRADFLLGRGDAYAITPTASHRVQVAYTTEQEIEAAAGSPAMEEWPYLESEILGQCPGGNGRPSPWPEAAEIGAAIAAARRGRGRPWLQARIEEDGGAKPGSGRADRILQLGRETRDWLETNGWCISATMQVIDI